MRDIGLTLAGGGNRSLYQLGLLRCWGPLIWPRIAAVACSSAGAAIVLLKLSGRTDEARALWDAQRLHIRRNLDLSRLLLGGPLLPHGALLGAVLREAFAGGGLQRIRDLPFPVLVLCTAPPATWPAAAATWIGIAAYELEKRLDSSRVHPTLGLRLGFRPQIVDARSCQTPEELAGLVLASSCMPPFIPLRTFRGESWLDGGLIDNVPAFVAEQERAVRANLVLLTRSYPTPPRHPTRLYISPSSPVPIRRWDNSRRAPVEATIRLGEGDAKHRATELQTWLEDKIQLDSNVWAGNGGATRGHPSLHAPISGSAPSSPHDQ